MYGYFSLNPPDQPHWSLGSCHTGSSSRGGGGNGGGKGGCVGGLGGENGGSDGGGGVDGGGVDGEVQCVRLAGQPAQ